MFYKSKNSDHCLTVLFYILYILSHKSFKIIFSFFSNNRSHYFEKLYFFIDFTIFFIIKKSVKSINDSIVALIKMVIDGIWINGNQNI